ncbi:uncharacterized protein BDW70DRAFT_119594 [Aspergillus foveolatus]|uniref:uncharacterized protein n=1 Tax=Aspergillus foveolatus TaxID=210207 RepID=UPI003CCDD364
MTDYGPPYGYAVRRNGSCNTAANEVECANPWDDWLNCCPEGTVCGDGAVCCPTDSGCAAPIEANPHCANNATWDLYRLDGYLCCDSDTNGFSFSGLVYNGSQTTGFGCADGYPTGRDTEVLVPVAYGNETDTDSSSSSTPSPTTTPSTSPQPDSPTASDTDLTSDSSSSSTNAGAIAGGVVGGVAGLALIIALIWFLLRRRRQAAAAMDAPIAGAGGVTEHFSTDSAKGPYAVAPAELENNAVRAELNGSQNQQDGIPHELPGAMPSR